MGAGGLGEGKVKGVKGTVIKSVSPGGVRNSGATRVYNTGLYISKLLRE